MKTNHEAFSKQSEYSVKSVLKRELRSVATFKELGYATNILSLAKTPMVEWCTRYYLNKLDYNDI